MLMNASAADLRIERTSSIETEPRTLTCEELRYAREAALCVSRTKTLEEAIGIFTEGLKPLPVLSVGRRQRGTAPVDPDDLMDELWDDRVRLRPAVLVGVKDVATAPF